MLFCFVFLGFFLKQTSLPSHITLNILCPSIIFWQMQIIWSHVTWGQRRENYYLIFKNNLEILVTTNTHSQLYNSNQTRKAFYKFTISFLRDCYLHKGVQKDIQWLKVNSLAPHNQKQPPSAFCNTSADLLRSMVASDTRSGREYVINSKADFHLDIFLYIPQLLYS